MELPDHLKTGCNDFMRPAPQQWIVLAAWVVPFVTLVGQAVRPLPAAIAQTDRIDTLPTQRIGIPNESFFRRVATVETPVCVGLISLCRESSMRIGESSVSRPFPVFARDRIAQRRPAFLGRTLAIRIGVASRSR